MQAIANLMRQNKTPTIDDLLKNCLPLVEMAVNLRAWADGVSDKNKHPLNASITVDRDGVKYDIVYDPKNDEFTIYLCGVEGDLIRQRRTVPGMTLYTHLVNWKE